MTPTHIDPETGEVKPGVFIRTPYNYDVDAASDEAGLACKDESLAQQSGKEDADINTLVARFGITGTMPQLDRVPMQGDFSEVGDYKSAVDAILAAEEKFMMLPADTRARFRNDPQEFLEFTSNPDNRPEMEKMGMVKPRPADPEPIRVRVIADPAEKPPTETPPTK